MKQPVTYYLLVAAVFLLLVSDSLLTTGMFMDGLIYSNVAANMAEGIGDFWHPTHSASLIPEFYGHPPLAMGMLALCYRLLGTSLWVTRLYSMCMTLLTALLLVRLWRRAGYSLRTGWMPLLLWTLVPAVTLNSHNYMLECTMAVFVLAAVLCLLHPVRRQGTRLLWAAAAGICLSLAFLTKGFTGLYPLSLPVILWLTDLCFHPHGRREHPFWMAVAETAVVLVSLGATLALVGLIQPEAWGFLRTYLSQQVVGGIETPIVDSRWYILKKFFEETAIDWGLAAVMIVLAAGARRRGEPTMPLASDWRRFAVLMLLTLAGVLPVMVSLKQRSFYILTVYSFFAVAVAALLQRATSHWLAQMGRWGHRLGNTVTLLALVAAIGLNIHHYGQPGRDEAMQNDMHQILSHLQHGEQVALSQQLAGEYSLKAYYYRDGRVTLMPVADLSDSTLPYRPLLTDDALAPSVQDLFQEIPLNTEQYKLYERRENP